MQFYRKIVTLCGLTFICTLAIAQNAYHIYEIKSNSIQKSGVNPGFLNRERDDAAEGSGWRTVKWDTLAKGYTSLDSLPFAIQFNGSTQRKFRATKNGLLTFNGSTAAAVNFVTEVGDSRNPSNSVVVGGIMARGGNDRVLVKTFGQSPNRQHWVKFHSFGVGADSTGKFGTYSYNAIVFEENSGSIHIVRMGWGSEFANYADSVPLLFKQGNGIQVGPFESYSLSVISDLYNEIKQQSKSFEDNSFVTFATGKNKIVDASLTQLYSSRPAGTSYVVAGSNVPLNIGAVFTLHGSDPSTDYNVNIQVNGAAPLVYPLPLLNFTDVKSAVLSYSIERNLQVGDRVRLKVWLSVNGGGSDDNAKNDTLPLIFDFIAQKNDVTVKTKVLVESYTATWCSQCPAANHILDSLMVKFAGNAVFVSHHVNDNMNNPFAPAAVDSLPFIVIDRSLVVADAKSYDAAIGAAVLNAYHAANVKVVDLVFNPKTKKVTGKLEVTALDALDKGSLRFGAMLKEKSVRGLGTGWDQKVEFRLTKDTQSVFFGKNKTLVGYYHNAVVWNVDGGKHGSILLGNAGVIKANDVLSYSFSLVVPDSMLSLGMPAVADFGPTGAIYSRFKPADLSVVGFVAADFGVGISESVNLGNYSAPVYSAVEQPLWDMKAGVTLVNKQTLVLYPNPAYDMVELMIDGKVNSVEFINVSGRVVLSAFNDNRIQVGDLLQGIYFVRVSTDRGVGTSRFIKE